MAMDRREFLTTTLAGAAGAALVGCQMAQTATAAAPKTANPYELVPLGKTGLKVSRVGLGTGMRGGNRQSNHTRLGKDVLEKFLRDAYERGVRLFDTADMYGSGPYIGRALKGYPRDSYVVTTKIWTRPGALPEKERPDADVVVDRLRKELDTDYLDLVLIHCMTDRDWADKQKRYVDKMAELKQKGVIKAHGVSIHSLPALRACPDLAWVDSVHARINPFGDAMDGKPEEVAPVLKEIHDAGKGVIGMKLVGEARYRNDDAKKDQSCRYVYGLGSVDAVVVGCENIGELDDIAKRVKAALEAKA